MDDFMVCVGGGRGYFLKKTNIMLVVSDPNLTRAERYFQRKGLNIFTRSHYLGVISGTPGHMRFDWSIGFSIGQEGS